MEKVHIRPRPGIKVRTPQGPHLPADGKAVELTSYWRRRIVDGDVLVGPADNAAAKPAALTVVEKPATDKPSGKR